MSIVFGPDDQSVSAKLDEVDGKLDEINEKLSELTRMFSDYKFSNQIDSYMADWGGYAETAITSFSGTLEQIDLNCADNEEKRKVQRVQFADNIILASNTDYCIDGKSLFQFLMNLKGQICDPCSGTACSLVEAYDRLCVLRYRWEHQGYESREGFHDRIASQFLTLATYYFVAARTFLEVHVDDAETLSNPLAYSETQGHLKNMFGNEAFVGTVDASADFALDDADPDSRCPSRSTT